MPGPFDSLFGSHLPGIEVCAAPVTQRDAFEEITRTAPNLGGGAAVQPVVTPGKAEEPSNRKRGREHSESKDEDDRSGKRQAVDGGKAVSPAKPPPTLGERRTRMEAILDVPEIKGAARNIVFVAPTELNTHAPQPRYFRMLVWNLENFTRDPRPRGAADIGSGRNQARIAVVAALVNRLDADVLLCMETGRDVGRAMTHMADRIRKGMDAKDPRTCHPLVSAPTHVAQVVAPNYARVAFGRRSVDRVLALRTLTSAYTVTAIVDAARPGVTQEQLQTALDLLRDSSPDVRFLTKPFEDAELAEGVIFPLSENNVVPSVAWLKRCADALGGGGSPAAVVSQALGELSGWCRDGTLAGNGAAGSTVTGLIDKVRSLYRQAVGADAGRARGALQLTELILLLTLKALDGLGDPYDVLWCADDLDAGLVPRAVFLHAACPAVRLTARKPDLGPLADADDPELIVDALRRIGALNKPGSKGKSYNVETYGMVYRPWTDRFATRFFDAACAEAHLDGKGIYGILRRDALKQTISLQEPGGMLSGRSALFVQFPVGPNRWLPVALHHNRFTGSADISGMNGPDKFKTLPSDEARVLRARTLSLIELARVGGLMSQPPLIVGDFNIPDAWLNVAARPQHHKSREKWDGERWIREELVHQVAAHGYVRRRVSAGDRHPLTSLKSYLTMAETDAVRSQPYDAVYQPFDFMDGSARVNSGVVESLDLLIPDRLWDEKIDAPAPELSNAGNVDDIEIVNIEDTADDGKAVVKKSVNKEGNVSQSITIGRVMAFEIHRIYRSVMYHFMADIGKAIISIQTAVSSEFRHEDKNVKANVHEKIDFNKTYFVISDKEELYQAVVERANRFHAEILKDKNIVFNSDSDPLARWIDELKNAEDDKTGEDTEGGRMYFSSIKRLKDLLTIARARLVAIETRPKQRMWMAYKAVVSDHLPLIVEVDLQPET